MVAELFRDAASISDEFLCGVVVARHGAGVAHDRPMRPRGPSLWEVGPAPPVRTLVRATLGGVRALRPWADAAGEAGLVRCLHGG